MAFHLIVALWRNKTMRKTISTDNYLIIDLALQDDISFEDIRRQTGLSQNDVVRLMRTSLRPASFRAWRKRVQGRKSKHRKLGRLSALP